MTKIGSCLQVEIQQVGAEYHHLPLESAFQVPPDPKIKANESVHPKLFSVENVYHALKHERLKDKKSKNSFPDL